jgi:putative nucleotidyltransferase with HDIG domain
MSDQAKQYIYSIIAIGMTALAYFLFQIDMSHLVHVLIIGLIAGILEKYIVELPNGTFFTGALAFNFIVLVYLGVAEAVIVELIIFMISNPLLKRSYIRAFYNVSQYIICIIIAGYSYQFLGGAAGSFSMSDVPRLLLTIGIYMICNLSMLSVVLHMMQETDYLETWIEMLQDGIYGYIVSFLLSFLLLFVYNFHNTQLFIFVTIFVLIFFLALRYAFGLFINLRKTYLTSMETLTHIKEARLSLNSGHSARVGRIARQLAEELNLSQETIDSIHYAALFHDIGKVRLTEDIFKKKGPLTVKEEEEYRTHVTLGAEMVKEISGLEKASGYVEEHHERWDGKGYPSGKKGAEISIGARIIAAADLYDHFIHNPQGKKGKSELEKSAENKLDPQLIEILSAILEAESIVNQKPLESNVKDTLIEKMVIDEARQKFYKSKLLKSFGASVIAVYDGAFKDEQGLEIELPARSQLVALVRKAMEGTSGVREIIEDQATGNVYDVYCVPNGEKIHVMLFDVNHILDYEKKQEDKVRALYRDVIYSVTQGKLLLVDKEDLDNLNDANIMPKIPITMKDDVALCRKQAQVLLRKYNVPDKLAFKIVLCTSEAVTNVLKHATSGSMSISYLNQTLRIIVKDNGSGIDLSELPKSTLLSGYSSKVSLGHGFNLILKLMDKVILNTSQKGTTVVMEMNLNKP